MAVIADDSPVQPKANPVDNTVNIKESPAQEEGFSIDKSQKVLQSCSIDQDSAKEPSPPLEVTAEPPEILPVHIKVKKKKRRRKQKSKKKIKAVVVIKGPRSEHSIFPRKFRLELPKKFLGKRGLIVALCSFLLCQQARCVLYCTTFVPVPDGPIILSNGDQNVILHDPTFCPENVPVFGTCTTCHTNRSRLQIACTAVPVDIWVKPGKRGGDGACVTMTSDDCSHFVEKRRGHRKKRSQLGPGIESKASKISVEEKNENMTLNGNDDEEICNMTVPVTDCPVVIKQDENIYTFHEAAPPCPQRADIWKDYSACFRDRSSLEITCRKNGEEKYRSLWVEHGKGQGLSSDVEMNSEVCHKIVKETKSSEIQGDRPGGETSTGSPKVVSVSEGKFSSEICNMTVPVTDCPVVIKQDENVYTFHEAAPPCPQRADIWKDYSACFRDRSSLEITCRKNGEEKYRSLWVEHGKGQGLSSDVEMNSEVCHKIVEETKTSEIQGDRPDGEMATGSPAGGKRKFIYGGIFLPVFFFIFILLTFGCALWR